MFRLSDAARRLRDGSLLKLTCVALVTVAGALSACNTQVPNALLCPSDQDSFAVMNESAYAVVMEFRVGPNPEDLVYIELGTAFAIGERLMATNAHVTEVFRTNTTAPMENVFAVQSGTGEVITLLRALTHPDYNGDPGTSPDVGLFTTQEALPAWLPLASEFEVSDLATGDRLLLTGFPGEVNDVIPIIPGVTVPQATSLSGPITALRAHDDTQAVDASNIDVIQHQIPTTPGTSGSPLVRCGEVVGVHNAGITQKVLQAGPNGTITEANIPSAGSNFGVHVRYIQEMVTLFNNQSLQGFELPPEFDSQGGQQPGQGGGVAQFAGNYAGNITQPATAAHSFTYTINQDGTVTGTSTWPNTGNFTLTGQVDAAGNIAITDDAQARLGFNTGIYAGQIAQNGAVTGSYFEGDTNNFIANWSASR